MFRRTKIIIALIGIFILIILILIILLLLSPRNQRPTSTSPTNQEVTTPGLPPLSVPTNIEPPPAEPQEQDPVIIASDFAARYGSYSNQGDYQNLRDLYIQMTPALQTNIDAYIVSHPLEQGEYSGTTTRVIRTEVLEQTNTTAKIKVYTQRTEATASNPQNRIYYQNADIGLKKEGLRWLVDSFDWLQQ